MDIYFPDFTCSNVFFIYRLYQSGLRGFQKNPHWLHELTLLLPWFPYAPPGRCTSQNNGCKSIHHKTPNKLHVYTFSVWRENVKLPNLSTTLSLSCALYSPFRNNIKDSYSLSSITEKSILPNNMAKCSWYQFKLNLSSPTFIILTSLLWRKCSLVMERVEIDISSNCDRDVIICVISICVYIVIPVIICRPCFPLQLSDKITSSERENCFAGLRAAMELLGSNLEAGCQELVNQKMSISSLRHENWFFQQKSDENESQWRREQCFICSPRSKSSWI